MKTRQNLNFTILLAMLVLLFTACRKKQVTFSTPPALSFKTGGNYISANALVPAGDTILVGVEASDNGSLDKLSTFVIRRVIDSMESETIREIKFTEGNNTKYSADFKFILNTAGKQVYTFIVENTHGVQTEKTLTFAVSQ